MRGMNDTPEQPHAPDVEERETVDNGFAAGWGLHMQPSVRYWLDSHTHMREEQARHALRATGDWHDVMWAFRLRRHVAVDGFPEQHDSLANAAAADDRLLWHCRLTPEQPDTDHLKRCKDLGAVGLKLHNAPIMAGDHDRTLMRSDAWHRVYELAGNLNMPILWHVTQRLTEAPYTGGGRNSYWKKGWEKGVDFTNEDLLQDFLAAVTAHRDTTFIGAHQLHLGPERLSSLFHEHPNLVVDTSIGCYVAPDDQMYEPDRKRWRDFVIPHADRILFGTDVVLSRQSANTELLRQHFLGHVRWVKQLQLPQDALLKVAHENFERLAGLEPVESFDWGALRP